MGTCIDSVIRFGGTNENKIRTALDRINKVQEATAQYSGNGVCDFSADPETSVDGSITWSCYHKSGDETVDDLRAQLIDLTVNGGFTLVFYWNCTDGYNECSIEKHQGGVPIVDLSWYQGVLEFDTACAAVELDQTDDPKALKLLVDEFLMTVGCEWDEDDLAALGNAHAVAATLAKAFQHWPHLYQDKSLRRKVQAVNRHLIHVREGADEFLSVDASEVDALQAFQAALEVMLLKQHTPTSSKASKAGCGQSSNLRI